VAHVNVIAPIKIVAFGYWVCIEIFIELMQGCKVVLKKVLIHFDLPPILLPLTKHEHQIFLRDDVKSNIL
jgi:hypothetical protein